jgi:hypothetical protein
MIKLPFELGADLIKNYYGLFGYACKTGSCICCEEFIVYSDDKDYYLMHKSELKNEK